MTIDLERTSDTKRKGDIANDVFAASTKDSRVVVVRQGDIRTFERLRPRLTSYPTITSALTLKEIKHETKRLTN